MRFFYRVTLGRHWMVERFILRLEDVSAVRVERADRRWEWISTG